MALRPVGDVSAADWFLDDAASTVLRANLGPSGFEAYARVLHRDVAGEREEGHLSDRLLHALCGVLAGHTTTVDDCFCALWEGYGDIHGGESAGFLIAFAGSPRWPSRLFTKEKPPPPVPPAFPPAVMNGPQLDHLGRRHFLFHGALTDAGRWDAAGWGNGAPRDINSPNLMWPADHAWFVTTSIDGTWTGVGGTVDLIDALLREPALEVVRTRHDDAALR